MASQDTARRKPRAFEVHCPVEISLLNMMRRFVVSVAEDMGFEQEDLIKIEMAVDEACSNVVRHAYGTDAKHGLSQGLELTIEMEPRALTLKIRDRGELDEPSGPVEFEAPRSIEEYQRINADSEQYNGLGILIMKQFMDEVSFNAMPEQGTLVTLTKFLREGAEAAAPVARTQGDPQPNEESP